MTQGCKNEDCLKQESWEAVYENTGGEMTDQSLVCCVPLSQLTVVLRDSTEGKPKTGARWNVL